MAIMSSATYSRSGKRSRHLAKMLGCIFNVYSINASMLASIYASMLASIYASLLAGVACSINAGSMLRLATLGPAGHSSGQTFLGCMLLHLYDTNTTTAPIAQ